LGVIDFQLIQHPIIQGAVVLELQGADRMRDPRSSLTGSA
jgi:hypothetical protein